MNKKLRMVHEKAYELKCGANEHQAAALYADDDADVPRHVWGPSLTYYDLLDMDVAANIVAEFKDTAFAIVEMANPVFIFLTDNPYRALAHSAINIDLNGKCIASNNEVRNGIITYFIESGNVPESIIAPSFEDYALELVKKNLPDIKLYTTNVRLITWTNIKATRWGILCQEVDDMQEDFVKDERIALAAVKHASSYAIAWVKDGATLAIKHSIHSIEEGLVNANYYDRNKKKELSLYDAIVATDIPFRNEQEAMPLLKHKKTIIFPGTYFEADKALHKRVKLTKFNHLRLA